MTDEQVQALTKANEPLVEALTRIERTIRSLACVQLVNTIYGRIELRSLRSDYQQLLDADQTAFKELTKIHEQKPGSGSAAETGHALKVREATSDRISAFEEAHPLVAELYYATTLSPT